MLPVGVTPCLSSTVTTSGRWMMRLISLLRRSITGRGVPAVVRTPTHWIARILEALFGRGRADRAAADAACGAVGDRADLAVLDMRKQHVRREHGEMGLAREHRLGRRRAAAIGDVLQLDAGAPAEQLDGQLGLAADAGRGVVVFAGVLLGERDELLQVLAGTPGCTKKNIALVLTSETGAKSFSVS